MRHRTNPLFSISIFLILAVLSVENVCGQSYRLGFVGTEFQGYGIRIDSITAGGPLTRLTQQYYPSSTYTGSANVGDYILAVNGARTRSQAELTQQMNGLGSSNGQCNVTIRSAYGIDSTWTTTADPVRRGGNTTAAPGKKWTLQFEAVADSMGRGIAVKSVTPGGAATKLTDPWNSTAASKCLQAGEIIFSANGIVTRTPADLERIVSNAGSSGRKVRLSILDTSTNYLRSYDTAAVAVEASISNEPVVDNDPDRNIEPIRVEKSNPENRKIHLFVCAQNGTNNETFNDSVSTSLKDLRKMLGYIGEDYLGSMQVFSKENCTAEKIKAALEDLKPGPRDAVLFYYAGHGAHDTSEQHYFVLRLSGGNDLYRKDVASILNEKGVRLSVLISDSCNARPVDPSMGEGMMKNIQSSNLTKLEDLLLNYSGTIDLNSVSLGEYGWGNPQYGGYYTKHFAAGLSGLSPGSGWRPELDEIANETNLFYRKLREYEMSRGMAGSKMKNQENMTPDYHTFNVTNDPSSIVPGTRTFDVY